MCPFRMEHEILYKNKQRRGEYMTEQRTTDRNEHDESDLKEYRKKKKEGIKGKKSERISQYSRSVCHRKSRDYYFLGYQARNIELSRASSGTSASMA